MFELENFDIKLETEFIGRNFIYCDEIESTNTELLAGKQQYKKTGTVMLAEKQLAGKGRKDRTWHSARGLNLTFSILLMKDVVSGININHLNLAASGDLMLRRPHGSGRIEGSSSRHPRGAQSATRPRR